MTYTPPKFDLYVRPRRALFSWWRFVGEFADLNAAIAAGQKHSGVQYEVRQVWAGGTTLKPSPQPTRADGRYGSGRDPVNVGEVDAARR